MNLELWSVIGTWVSSIGTVAAVITSLWFSYRQNRLRLSVTAGHRIIINPGSNQTPEYCMIRVVNKGDRMARIISVGWQAGRFRDKVYFAQVFGTPGFDDVPKNLEHGEEATFMIPLNLRGTNEDWIKSFPIRINEGNPRRLNSLRVLIGTSIGQNFKTRLERNMLNRLKESFKANNSLKSGTPENGAP